jgi:hypothetical protein
MDPFLWTYLGWRRFPRDLSAFEVGLFLHSPQRIFASYANATRCGCVWAPPRHRN